MNLRYKFKKYREVIFTKVASGYYMYKLTKIAFNFIHSTSLIVENYFSRINLVYYPNGKAMHFQTSKKVIAYTPSILTYMDGLVIYGWP